MTFKKVANKMRERGIICINVNGGLGSVVKRFYKQVKNFVRNCNVCSNYILFKLLFVVYICKISVAF